MIKMSKEFSELQDQHKKLDRETTDLEKARLGDRTTKSKYTLVELKKAKLAIKDKINFLRKNAHNN